MSFLTDKERESLKIQHKKERDKRVCDRIKAVMLYDKGWSFAQIAAALLLTSEGIRKQIEDYKRDKKLNPAGGGSSEKLSQEQSKQLEDHLKDHTYLYVKDIVSYVEAQFGVKYTIHGLRNWLQRHGFTYKKPALVPGKADQTAQKQWMESYSALKNQLSSDETICFIDGVHPTHNVQPAYGWIKKGTRKLLPSNSGRKRLNLVGLVDILTHRVMIQEEKTLNAQSTIEFFRKIEEFYPDKGKIHVFCDNARYYRNKAVSAYLLTSKVELHFLPPYSPNMNPIERLWKWMKERTLYNQYYAGFKEFKQAIFSFFEDLSMAPIESELAQTFRRRVRDKFRPLELAVIQEKNNN